MKAKLNRLMIYVCAITFIISFSIPFIYWINNPELSQMEVFLHCWWNLLIGMIVAVIGITQIKI